MLMVVGGIKVGGEEGVPGTWEDTVAIYALIFMDILLHAKLFNYVK